MKQQSKVGAPKFKVGKSGSVLIKIIEDDSEKRLRVKAD